MKVNGRVWRFSDNINTDEIIPARYLNTSKPNELAKHCMEDVDPLFSKRVKKGDIIVAGTNFGCGSSREHAPIAIKATGIACVIAKSFARIFYRNAFNTGLPILVSEQAVDLLDEGDIVEVSFATGEILLLKNKMIVKADPIPAFMQSLLQAGGLMNYVTRKSKL